MFSKAAPQSMDLSITQEMTNKTGSIATRKIWLPKVLYDCLPYFYLTSGFAAFFATLYISDWFWVLPHYFLFSAACMHLGFVVLRRRRLIRQQSQATSE
jgi:hypothetical protein